MDIKVKAKLSAYTRVNKIEEFPIIKDSDNGKVVGIEEGKFSFISPISNEEIDLLFD